MKSAENAWCLYDVGNSAFATTAMAAVLPVYFTTVAGADLPPAVATSHWGYANSLAMALTALSAPVLGAIADAGAGRKRLLALFAGLGAASIAAVACTGPGQWLAVALLYVLGRMAFSASIVVYDALLPHVADPEQLDRVSAKGFAWGYLGGGILLAAQLVVIRHPAWVGLPDATAATRLAFVSVGVWWIVFTVPLMRTVPEGRLAAGAGEGTTGGVAAIVRGFRLLQRTAKELRRYREAWKFLAAFWLYNDGIGTIVVMAAAFGAELGLDRSALIAAILLVQFLGFPFSLLFGRLAGRIGARNAILIGLFGYTLLCGGAWFLRTERDFFLLAIGVSAFQGGCQALSRSLFARMIPAERSAEFFGFYDVSSKFAGIVGPFLLATVARATGSSRLGVVALIVLFLAGMAVLSRVDPERGRTEAAIDAPAA